jgi:hypothetical protein
MSQKQGWISISRELKSHWVYSKPEALRAWLTILFCANFKDGKMILGKKTYTVKRGQSSMSLRSWANELEMGVKAVVTIFDLLESDNMITRKTIGNGKHSTTLITITNYSNYQDLQETIEKRNGIERETLGQHEGNANGIQYNNGNNDNNVNNDNKKPSYEDFLKYAIENKPNVKKKDVEFKYKAWEESGWCTNRKDKLHPILNWKTTLLNSLKYMDENGSEIKIVS